MKFPHTTKQRVYKINATDGKYGHPTQRVKNNNMYTDYGLRRWTRQRQLED